MGVAHRLGQVVWEVVAGWMVEHSVWVVVESEPVEVDDLQPGGQPT